METRIKARSLFDPSIVRRAMIDALIKLDPRHQVKNPVMFVVEVGSLLTTALAIQALVGQGEAPAGFIIAISLWLWFTVIFANFAEAIAGSGPRIGLAAAPCFALPSRWRARHHRSHRKRSARQASHCEPANEPSRPQSASMGRGSSWPTKTSAS